MMFARWYLSVVCLLLIITSDMSWCPPCTSSDCLAPSSSYARLFLLSSSSTTATGSPWKPLRDTRRGWVMEGERRTARDTEREGARERERARFVCIHSNGTYPSMWNVGEEAHFSRLAEVGGTVSSQLSHWMISGGSPAGISITWTALKHLPASFVTVTKEGAHLSHNNTLFFHF